MAQSFEAPPGSEIHIIRRRVCAGQKDRYNNISKQIPHFESNLIGCFHSGNRYEKNNEWQRPYLISSRAYASFEPLPSMPNLDDALEEQGLLAEASE